MWSPAVSPTGCMVLVGPPGGENDGDRVAPHSGPLSLSSSAFSLVDLTTQRRTGRWELHGGIHTATATATAASTTTFNPCKDRQAWWCGGTGGTPSSPILPSSSQRFQTTPFSAFATHRNKNHSTPTRHTGLLGADEDDEDDEGEWGSSSPQKAIWKGGDHLALVFSHPSDTIAKSSGRGATSEEGVGEADREDNGTSFFYSAMILRSDTMAVDWCAGPLLPPPSRCQGGRGRRANGVEDTDSLPQIACAALLSSSLLCGVAMMSTTTTTTNPKVNGGQTGGGVVGALHPVFFVAAAPSRRFRRHASSSIRAFVSTPHSFSFDDISLDNDDDNEKKKKNLSRCLGEVETTLPIALTATSACSCAVLFASGAMYAIRVQQEQEDDGKAREEEGDRLNNNNNNAHLCSFDDTKENNNNNNNNSSSSSSSTVRVLATFLSRVPIEAEEGKTKELVASEESQRGWLHSMMTTSGGRMGGFFLSSPHFSCGNSVVRSYKLLALFDGESVGATASVIGVYAQTTTEEAAGKRRPAKDDSSSSALWLLPLTHHPHNTQEIRSGPAPPPPRCAVGRWSCVHVHKDYRLQHAQFIFNGFPSATSSAAAAPTSLIIMHLKSRCLPDVYAVQCGIVTSSSSSSSSAGNEKGNTSSNSNSKNDDTRAQVDAVTLPPLRLPNTSTSTTPQSSLHLLCSFYHPTEQTLSIVCGSAKRASFFHEVRASSAHTKRWMKMDRNDEERKEEEWELLLQAYPESWVVLRVPFSPEHGGYAPNLFVATRDEEAGVWQHSTATATASPPPNWTPLVSGEGESAEEDALTALLHRSGAAPSGGDGGGITLEYPLTHLLPSETGGWRAEVTLTSITVPARVHTRLAKQCHNGVRGLLLIVREALRGSPALAKSGSEWRGNCYFSLLVHQHWHPKYIRRVLKLLSTTQLGQLLRRVCEWIHHASSLPVASSLIAAEARDTAENERRRTSSCCSSSRDDSGGGGGVWYFKACSAATDLALHIISISRQRGLSLVPFLTRSSEVKYGCTLEPLLWVIRGGRALAHPLRQLLPRVQLMSESTRQHRLLQALKKKKTASASEGQENDDDEEERSLYALGAVMDRLRTGRRGYRGATAALTTTGLKYTPNAWVTSLASRLPEISQVTGVAANYLQELEEEEDGEPTTWGMREGGTNHHPVSTTAKDDDDDESGGASAPHLLPAAHHRLSEWVKWGRRPHEDDVLRRFESLLVE